MTRTLACGFGLVLLESTILVARPVLVIPDLAAVGRPILPPCVIILGSPQQAAWLASQVGEGEIVCYQMDLYQTRAAS